MNDLTDLAESTGSDEQPENAESETAESETVEAVEAPATDAGSEEPTEAESEGEASSSDGSTETEPEAAVEEPAEPSDEESGEEVEEPVDIPAPKPVSPFDLPGDWYVIHSYSGYENKVKANLETRAHSMHLEDTIFEVVIPMEDVVEIKNGKKVTVPRKMFPGYILCRMYLTDDSWYAVRNTPGVTGFVGSANKPVPLSRREVEKFLGVKEEEETKAPRFKPEWETGDSVRVIVGPFADFNGVIESINLDQSKVVVLVNIFGRDTPVELGFSDIQKN